MLPCAVLAALAPLPGEFMVDATVGAGGHAALLKAAVQPGGWVLGMDRDGEALRWAEERLAGVSGRHELLAAAFGDLATKLVERGERPDGILMDLGVSSMQLDTAERGFSFQREAELDMRMDRGQGETARSLLSRLSESELAGLLMELGDEPRAGRIARTIVAARARAPIVTTTRLATLIEQAVGGSRGRIHPATRSFQALRLAVNDELGQLERALATIPPLLAPGGRMAVVAFHSLEDRLVKRSFRGWVAADAGFETPGRQPVLPQAAECRANPRARSARLRWIRRRMAEA